MTSRFRDRRNRERLKSGLAREEPGVEFRAPETELREYERQPGLVAGAQHPAGGALPIIVPRTTGSAPLLPRRSSRDGRAVNALPER